MPESKLLLPKFLTKHIAEWAIRVLFDAISNRQVRISQLFEKSAFYVVVLVPAMRNDTELSYPNYPIQPHVIAELYYGNGSDYAEIAQCKALQLWHDRNDGGTDVKPHLLMTGDTRYWGGVKRDGIVVSCSGLQPHFDRMVAGMIADLCIGLAYSEYAKWEAENTTDDFVI